MLNFKKIVERTIVSIIGQYNYKLLLSKIKGGNIHNYEEANWIFKYFKKYRKSGVLIDVGAHHGESFAPYLKLDWQIYAFEPDPNNFNQIPHSKKVKLFDYAISDYEDGSVSFFSSAESTGISALSAFRDTHKEIVKVRLIPLRKFIELEQISTVDYLKIDAEGHDLFCLKGFPFEIIKPEVILCEFEDNKTLLLGYTYKDLGAFLVERGYHVLISEWEPIVRYGVKHNWRAIKKFPSNLDSEGAWGNLIALNSKDNFNRILYLINKSIA